MLGTPYPQRRAGQERACGCTSVGSFDLIIQSINFPAFADSRSLPKYVSQCFCPCAGAARLNSLSIRGMVAGGPCSRWKPVSLPPGLHETVLLLGAGMASLPGTLLFQQISLRCFILMQRLTRVLVNRRKAFVCRSLCARTRVCSEPEPCRLLLGWMEEILA